jgi:hypothetical protein
MVGNKKTFVVNHEIDGKPAKLRYTEVQVPPTFYTYPAEVPIDGGP